ncbi:MAG TPA: transposase, partial [Pseudonocardiaceae bacterium]
MYHTTGLHKAEILDLCEMIHKEATEDGQVWPPIVGLCKSVVIALIYMRRNRVQVELAETYDVS